MMIEHTVTEKLIVFGSMPVVVFLTIALIRGLIVT